MDRVCPFCDKPASDTACSSCGRDPTAPRKVCSACQNMTPTAEGACCRCGKSQHSEMWWKIPLIVALFIAAIILSIILALVD